MRAMRALATAIGMCIWALPGWAQGPVVVELFTSQGCSNCPPADALLGEMTQNENIIPLSWHVDYWDYIGWEDTFADPAFTARQHGYARAAHSSVVYTPQMIISGSTHVAGNSPMTVFQEVSAEFEAPDPLSITIMRTGETFNLSITAAGDGPRGGVDVQLIGYVPHSIVDIRRGENANTRMEYHNTVRSWQLMGQWDGAGVFTVEFTVSDDHHYVVIAQQEGLGPILAAARVE